MTIVTKPLSDKKQDQLKKPLVIAGAEEVDPNVDVEAPGSLRFQVRVTRKPSLFRLFLLFLTSLAVLGLGIVGGLTLYRHCFGRGSSNRVQGWFQVPSVHSESASSKVTPNLEIPEYLRSALNITEEFDIDMNSDMENINVPDFGQGRRGRFIHDFNANKTGIVDMEGKRCFVLPLNRARVLPPRSMYDLINKIWDGYYEVDTEVIRETFRVDLPPVTRMQDMGKFIYRECKGLPTYRLIRTRETLFKRSLIAMHEYSEFAGNKMVNFRIMMDGVHDYEKDHKLIPV